jgi:hypothetical protein
MVAVMAETASAVSQRLETDHFHGREPSRWKEFIVKMSSIFGFGKFLFIKPVLCNDAS